MAKSNLPTGLDEPSSPQMPRREPICAIKSTVHEYSCHDSSSLGPRNMPSIGSPSVMPCRLETRGVICQSRDWRASRNMPRRSKALSHACLIIKAQAGIFGRCFCAVLLARCFRPGAFGRCFWPAAWIRCSWLVLLASKVFFGQRLQLNFHPNYIGTIGSCLCYFSLWLIYQVMIMCSWWPIISRKNGRA